VSFIFYYKENWVVNIHNDSILFNVS